MSGNKKYLWGTACLGCVALLFSTWAGCDNEPAPQGNDDKATPPVGLTVPEGEPSPAPPSQPGPQFEEIGEAEEIIIPSPDRVATAEELGIEMTPIVEWEGRQGVSPQYPYLRLGVIMRGGAAAEAWQFGWLECHCVLEEGGEESSIEKQIFHDYMRLATRESGPADGVEAVTSFARPNPVPEQVYSCEGSLRLLVGGEVERVVIENVTSQAGNYRDPVLEAAGIEKIEIQYEPFPDAQPPYARLSVLSPHGPIAGVGMASASGQPLPKQVPLALGFSEAGNSYSFILPSIPAAEDQLWIDIVTGAENIEVPFHFENLHLPEMP